MPPRTEKKLKATGRSTRGTTQGSAGSPETQYSSDFSEAGTLYDPGPRNPTSSNKRKRNEKDNALAPTIEDMLHPWGSSDNGTSRAIDSPLPESENPVSKAMREARSAVSSAIKKGRSKRTEKRQRGSKRLPSDPLPRKKIDVNKLDLHKSYAGLKKTESAARPPNKNKKTKRKTWGPYKPPIEDLKLVPKGWSHQELDLDIDDIDAQIARCHERIAEGILPGVFQHRLEGFLDIKRMDSKISEGWPKGLDIEVYRRLNTLRDIKEHLSTKSDGYKQLPNVNALISAYKKKSLKWNQGLVTYWSKGVKLCEPRPFDWDEFEAINEKHDGHEAFWVEGIARDGYEFPHFEIFPQQNDITMHKYNIALRIPGYDWWEELEFMHDTGSSTMCITDRDIPTIAGPCRPPDYRAPPVIGMSKVHAAGTGESVSFFDYIELECTLVHPDTRHRMTEWTRIQVRIKPYQTNADTHFPNMRLDGPEIPRSTFWTHVPDNTFRIHALTSKLGLASLPLAANREKRHGPEPAAFPQMPIPRTINLAAYPVPGHLVGVRKDMLP